MLDYRSVPPHLNRALNPGLCKLKVSALPTELHLQEDAETSSFPKGEKNYILKYNHLVPKVMSFMG